MGQAKLRGTFNQRRQEALDRSGLTVCVTYENANGKESVTYALQEFFKSDIGNAFKQLLLTNNRLCITESVKIVTVHDEAITVSLLRRTDS